MLKILGLDFETQTTDTQNTPITEIGYVRTSIEEIVKVVGKIPEDFSLSAFCYTPEYLPQSKEVVDLTGITDEMLKSGGMHPRRALEILTQHMDEADYVMAYNAQFDREVYSHNCVRYGVPTSKAKWICAMSDVPYDEKFKCKKLSHLALDHKIPMDNRTLHRAVDDVRLMFDLVFTQFTLEQILCYMQEPWITARIIIPAPWEDNGVGKDTAKRLRYSWQECGDGKTYKSCWVKRVKGRQIEELQKQAGEYKVVML